ncbi:LysE family transporter [Candidatus Pelagibacter sp.]|nr:LysE family transporter [Candidatus Pelagibacter sp.]
MEFLLLGFFTSLSLILAIGAQNLFVIEQGLKKQYTFIVCFICSISDCFLIFIGIFLFNYFNQYFTLKIELIFNILLVIFLIYFICSKIKLKSKQIEFNQNFKKTSLVSVIFKTLGFTYLNPHVYADTVFFLGNFSKSFLINDKIIFGVGASIASILFFFSIGYASNYFSKYLNNKKIWNIINWIIIFIMSVITLYVLREIVYSINL